MTADLEHVTQWQSLRRLDAAGDTLLTEYAPSDLTAAVKAKMVKVAPATAILIQPLVLGDDLGTFVLTISGWMDYTKKAGSGPGLKFYSGTVTAGGRVWTAAENPLVGGRAEGLAGWISGVWRICDKIPGDGTVTADPNYASAFAEVKVDTDGILFLPTLGYPYLLAEISSLVNVSKVGLLWRPISLGNVVTKTHAYS